MNEEQFLATLNSQAEQRLTEGYTPEVVESWKARQLDRWKEHQSVPSLDEVKSLDDVSEEEKQNILFPNRDTETVTGFDGEVEVPTQVADTFKEQDGEDLIDLLTNPERQEERQQNIEVYEAEQEAIEEARLQYNIEVEENIQEFQDDIPEWASYLVPVLGLLKKSDKAVELASGIPRATIDIVQSILDYGSAVTEQGIRIYDYNFNEEEFDYFENNPEEALARFEGLRIDLDNPLQDYRYQYAGSAVEDIYSGRDPIQGVYRIALGVTEAAPSIAISTLGPGGIVALGASAAGSSYTETRRAHPELDSSAVFLTSSIKGGFEAVSETVTARLFKLGKGLYKAGGKNAVDAYSTNLFKQYAKGFGLEATSETGADLAGHLLDYAAYDIEPPKDLWKQLADTFIISGITGTATVGAGHRRALAMRYESVGKKEADQADIEKLNTIVGALQTATDPEEIQALNQEMAATITSLNERQLEHNTVINDLTKQEVKDLAKNNAEVLKYERFLNNNPNLSEQAQEIYRNKIADAQSRAQEVYGKAAQYQEALQEAAALKAEVQAKRDKLDEQEKALAKSENPNKTGTEKIRQQREELAEQDRIIDEKLHNFRPTVSTKQVAKQVDSQIEAQKNRHKENMETLEAQGATAVEINNETVQHEATMSDLQSLKDRVSELGKTRGDQKREDGKAEITNELAKSAISKARVKAAKEVAPNSAESLAALNTSPKSKTEAAKVVFDANGNVESIKNYLLENSSPYTAQTALESIADAAMVNNDLTEAEQTKLVEELHQAAYNVSKSTKSTSFGNKEKLDKVRGKLQDIQEQDASKLESLIDKTISNFEKEVANKVDAREEIDVTQREADNEIEVEKAKRTFNDFLADSVNTFKDWVAATTGVSANLKRLTHQQRHAIISEGIVGNKAEDFKFDNSYSNSTLTRLGKMAYDELKRLGKPTNQFEKTPPKVLEAMERAGLDSDQIKARTLSLNYLRAGGELLKGIGGVNGFFRYERGNPGSPRHRYDLNFKITDFDAAEEGGLIDALGKLQQSGAIKLNKDWATSEKGAFIEIKNRKEFDRVIGFTKFQQALKDAEVIYKEEDWHENENTIIKVTDTAKMQEYLRGATLYSYTNTDDSDAKFTQPLDTKPSAWSKFTHALGLDAITNATPEIKKAFKDVQKNVLKTLTNASSVKYTADQRTWEILEVAQPYVYTYKDKESKVQGDLVEEYYTIQDIAKKYLNKDFYVMHFMDWRGRLYNRIKYFNFQANKVAKSLYRYGDYKEIGRQGFVDIISQAGDYFGADIVELANGEIEVYNKQNPAHKGLKVIPSKMMTKYDRFRVGMMLYKNIANIAANPLKEDADGNLVNMDFLNHAGDKGDIIALSTELLNIAEHAKAGNDPTTYQSNYILWNDATISGAQNLGLLTHDGTTLALVNGRDLYQRGDLYREVGNSVMTDMGKHEPWDPEVDQPKLDKITAKVDKTLDKISNPWNYKEEYQAWKKAKEAEGKSGKMTQWIKSLKKEISDTVNETENAKVAAKYWTDPSRQGYIRSIAKGPVMTGFYSAGAWVMAEDLITDFQHEIGPNNTQPFIDVTQGLALFLTERLKATTAVKAPGAKLAQSTFGRLATIVTDADHVVRTEGFFNDFPFVQDYKRYKTLRDDDGKEFTYSVRYTNPDNTSLRFSADTKNAAGKTLKGISATVKLGVAVPDYIRISTASAPNLTHNLDGQIVASQFRDEIARQYSVSTIHDNFGTHAADASKQVQDVKDAMAEMYSGEPMERLINQVLWFDPPLANEEIRRYNAKRNALIEAGKIVPADPNEIRNNDYAISSAGGTNRFVWGDTEVKEELGNDIMKEVLDAQGSKPLTKEEVEAVKQGKTVEEVKQQTEVEKNGPTKSKRLDKAKKTEGKVAAKQLADEDVKFNKLKLFGSGFTGRFLLQQFANLPALLKHSLRNDFTVTKFMRVSGLRDVIAGANQAKYEVNGMEKVFAQVFLKKTPNGKEFLDAYNDVERGMFAYLNRTTKDAKYHSGEFNRRKRAIQESIVALKRSGDSDLAKVYEQVFDKFKDTRSIDDLEGTIDQTNLAAVRWMQGEWNKIYSPLAGFSLDYYNTQLEDDINYTPDVYIKLTEDVKDPEHLDDNHPFKEGISTKKVGNLYESQRPKVLPKGRAIDLRFTASNFDKLKKAYNFIYTADSDFKLKGFLSSNAFRDMFENNEDAAVVTDRIVSFQNLSRETGYKSTDSAETKALVRFLEEGSKLAYGAALGGITQPIKQYVSPLVNTAILTGSNLKRADIVDAFNKNSTLYQFLVESNNPIINRGLEAETLSSDAKRLQAKITKEEGLMNSALEAGKDVTDFIIKINNLKLELTVALGDKGVARTSYAAHYRQFLSDNNIEFVSWDHQLENRNKEADDYAQYMVDRTQNVSDFNLMGKAFTAKGGAQKFLKWTYLAFQNFGIAQKFRVITDASILLDSKTDSQTKKRAAASLTGVGSEILAFHAISLGISYGLKAISLGLLGYDDEEKERILDKYLDTLVKGRVTTTVRDLFPLPVVDLFAPDLVNTLAEQAGYKEPLYGERPQTFVDRLGLFGILWDKYVAHLSKAVNNVTGDATRENFWTGETETKEIVRNKEYRDIIQLTGFLRLLEFVGLGTTETSTVLRNIEKEIFRKGNRPVSNEPTDNRPNTIDYDILEKVE